jgi:molybdopterin/thiamine biosynthesis adenylyltransferase
VTDVDSFAPVIDSIGGESKIEVRIAEELFNVVQDHVQDLSEGEQGGFLLCSQVRSEQGLILIAREWMPVPASLAVRDGREFMLAWPPTFNAQVIDSAAAIGAAPLLVHSHGNSSRPRLSEPDLRNASKLFSSMSRILGGSTCGSIVLGNGSASGQFWIRGRVSGELGFVRIVGAPIMKWHPAPRPRRIARRRLDRQTRAIGWQSEVLLAEATAAVIGLSGGGSHVCQQLVHQGFGHLVGIDDQMVEDVQLGRMMGATQYDVDNSFKTEVMRRLAESVNPEVDFTEVRARFPAAETREILKLSDVVIACVDSFGARQQINAFCRRFHLPLIDVGMSIRTDADGQLLSAAGQVIVVLPDSPCLQCGPLLSDAVLDRERRERPPGYDLNPEAAGDPQVASMNGVLASEAVNCALDLVTGFARGDRGAGWWVYDGRSGRLERSPHPRRKPGCPACGEQGLGDPQVLD